MRPATRPHPGPAPAPPVSDGPPLGEPPQVPPPARRGAPGDDIQARCEQAGVEQVELQYT
ncbi:MAG: hypothetical protein QOE92_383, partial [Chloroflexota bacterium]|nr:hypothetical protein [Chloroflexota bacterium]